MVCIGSGPFQQLCAICRTTFDMSVSGNLDCEVPSEAQQIGAVPTYVTLCGLL